MRKTIGRILLIIGFIILIAWGINEYLFPVLPQRVSNFISPILSLVVLVIGTLASFQQLTGGLIKRTDSGFVLAIRSDSRYTYFYVPDETQNRYNQPDRNSSYSIFRFQFEITSYSKITIKEIGAYAFHTQANPRYWGELEFGCDFGQIVGLPQTTQVLRNFNGANHGFSELTIDKTSTTLVVPKCGYHQWSLEHGENYRLFCILTFLINTTYLWVLCVVPEMSMPYEASILDYKLSHENTREKIVSWAGDHAQRARKAKAKNRIVLRSQLE